MKKLNKATLKTRKRYNRFSWFYDFVEKPIELNVFSKWRRDLLGNLRGNVLEIGVGTGKNLEYYNNEAKVTGIDLSPGMLSKARIKLENLGNKNIKLLEMDAQNLNFKDNSFDYVVCTFVLCSVPDPILALKGMKRVVKNNGKILMLEHMLSDRWWIAFFEHLHNPLTKFLFGFNVNRRTVSNVKRSGLKVNKVKNLALFDVFRRIEASKINSGGKR